MKFKLIQSKDNKQSLKPRNIFKITKKYLVLNTVISQFFIERLYAMYKGSGPSDIRPCKMSPRVIAGFPVATTKTLFAKGP